jgi:hypothetical protein
VKEKDVVARVWRFELFRAATIWAQAASAQLQSPAFHERSGTPAKDLGPGRDDPVGDDHLALESGAADLAVNLGQTAVIQRDRVTQRAAARGWAGGQGWVSGAPRERRGGSSPGSSGGS